MGTSATPLESRRKAASFRIPLSGARFWTAALCLAALANPTEAGVDRWSRVGPFADGGLSVALAIDLQQPDTVYVGTAGGVFKSTDAGAAWTLANEGLNGTISDLAVDPESSGTVYASTYSYGVFKTTDGGQSWRPINWGLPHHYSYIPDVFAIAVDPTRSTTLYAGLNGYLGSVFKSTDAGANWTKLHLERDPAVYGFAVDPSDGDTVYAATFRGVYRTKNGGRTWSPQNAGLELVDDNGGGSLIRFVEIDPTSSRTLFAATWAGLFRSTDRGDTWAPVDNGLPQGVERLALAFSGSTVYVSVRGGGVFRSDDGGLTWTNAAVGLRSPYVIALALDPRDDSTLYAAMSLREHGGVAKTTDRGSTWQSLPGKFRPIRVLDLVLDPNLPSRLYSATELGVSRSADGGATWDLANSNLPEGEVTRLAIDPRSSDVYAVLGRSSALYKTTNGGSSWSRAGNGLPTTNQSIYSLTVLPTAPISTLYAGVGYSGVFKSTDGGGTWTSLGPPALTITALAADARTPLIVYAGSADGKILRSSNGGASWTAVYNQSNRQISCLKIDPVTPTTLYAGWGYSGIAPGGFVPPGGILKSVDHGMTWRELGNGPALAVGAMAIDPDVPSRIFAGTIREFWRSADGGESWRVQSDGLPQFFFTSSIEIDPRSTSTVYAAVLEADAGGVFKMTVGPDRAVPVVPCRADECPERPQPRVLSPRFAPPQTP